MSQDTPVTNEDIMRVRRHECAIEGHDFDIIQLSGSNDPKLILCSRCGAQWEASDVSLARIGRGCPVCPTCREPLIERMPDRRFMENNCFVQCPNHHVWNLKAV